ncbi:MAG: glucose 1-dehydrogenase [Pseudomonadota bacterium]
MIAAIRKGVCVGRIFMTRFNGKTVLLSGAASGFGRLAAQRLAEEGAKLSLTDLDADGLAETVAALADAEVIVNAGDVADEDHHLRIVEQTLDQFGSLDIALNNAGVFTELKRIEDTTADEFDRMININTKGVFLALKAQLPVMAKTGSGSILNTASVAGITGAGHCAAYAASKHAVVGLTKSAADEYSRYGVRVNAICPSFAKTPMLYGFADTLANKYGEDREDAYKRLSGRIPMGRMGEAHEVVEAMLLISDPANTFMTGQAIAVDGGLSAI